jgi:hypothetical protein
MKEVDQIIIFFTTKMSSLSPRSDSYELKYEWGGLVEVMKNLPDYKNDDPVVEDFYHMFLMIEKSTSFREMSDAIDSLFATEEQINRINSRLFDVLNKCKYICDGRKPHFVFIGWNEKHKLYCSCEENAFDVLVKNDYLEAVHLFLHSTSKDDNDLTFKVDEITKRAASWRSINILKWGLPKVSQKTIQDVETNLVERSSVPLTHELVDLLEKWVDRTSRYPCYIGNYNTVEINRRLKTLGYRLRESVFCEHDDVEQLSEFCPDVSHSYYHDNLIFRERSFDCLRFILRNETNDRKIRKYIKMFIKDPFYGEKGLNLLRMFVHQFNDQFTQFKTLRDQGCKYHKIFDLVQVAVEKTGLIIDETFVSRALRTRYSRLLKYCLPIFLHNKSVEDLTRISVEYKVSLKYPKRNKYQKVFRLLEKYGVSLPEETSK